ncbi:hydroxyacetone-like kinase [Rhodococcus ruber BKS 20-38]|uniref:Hydroxyacetone-like kinase n=1 Tax=Rhodococcus ruber BKS 20-38 TaxID=1278076 RepID=M2YVG7_9NOCA|nr:DAK2 domain-containing protein [Rhodococcus ruber]EME52354.1 hydroxyacetone-like kinase [Rhodococcus ruber BKS 20-38]
MLEVGEAVDGTALRRWVDLGLRVLAERRDEINSLNVFPVPDGDTGTNLLVTLRSAAAELDTSAADADDVATIVGALARGAFHGARGNSGVILAQMLRGLADALDGAVVVDATELGRAWCHAADLVTGALSCPAEGTIVSVLHAAADGAHAAGGSGSLVTVATAAADAAADAVQRTTAQLDVLAEAGVVDAGGLGLLLLLDAFVETVSGRRPDRAPIATSRPGAPARHVGHDGHGLRDDGQDFEVMYFVEDSDTTRMDVLRTRLDALGDSVAVVGDGAGTWSVHVHCCDAGAAVEAGLEAGRLHQVTVTCFALEAQQRIGVDPVGSGAGTRSVLAVVAGDGAAELFEAEGAAIVRADDPITRRHLLDAIRRLGSRDVMVLPNGALPAQELVAVGAAARDHRREVMFLPCSSMVQGLASLAVHDPGRDSADDAFAMSEAAAATRWGSLRIANERALTWVGTCEPGHSLGLSGHDVVVIEHDLVTAGASLLDKVLAAGGELVTMLVGLDAPDGLAEQLTRHVNDRHPEVEVLVYHGGQRSDLLQLGVE